MLQFALGLIDLCGSDPWIQTQQSLPKIPGQQNLFLAFAAKGAVLAQLLRVVGKGNLPAQLILEQVTGGFLDKDIFGIVVAHKITISYFLTTSLTLHMIVDSAKTDTVHLVCRLLTVGCLLYGLSAHPKSTMLQTYQEKPQKHC